MPLRVANGVSITPQFPSPVVEELMAAEPPPPMNNFLPLDAPVLPAPFAPRALQRFSQERLQWCWAACAQMVATFYNRNSRQCRFASFLFNEDGCCSEGMSFNSDCDQSCDGDDVALIYNQMGLSATRRHFAVRFSDVVSELRNGRPVEVGLKWTRDQLRGGHLVIVYGFSPGENSEDGWVRVNDPWDEFQPQGEIRYSYLLAAYGMGVWSDTWINIREQV